MLQSGKYVVILESLPFLPSFVLPCLPNRDPSPRDSRGLWMMQCTAPQLVAFDLGPFVFFSVTAVPLTVIMSVMHQRTTPAFFAQYSILCL